MQQKVFEEVQSLFGDDLTVPLTMQDLNSLSYLDLVIKETLRLFPSVPFFGRKIFADLIIGSVTIPQDTTVIVSPYYLGRDPNIFPDPLKFNPSRFDVGASEEKINTSAYIPFSAGLRNCKIFFFTLKCVVLIFLF